MTASAAAAVGAKLPPLPCKPTTLQTQKRESLGFEIRHLHRRPHPPPPGGHQRLQVEEGHGQPEHQIRGQRKNRWVHSERSRASVSTRKRKREAADCRDVNRWRRSRKVDIHRLLGFWCCLN
ncbi:hypothetical protein EV1_024254 [Malus domestica]